MSLLYPNVRADNGAALMFHVGSRSEAGVERIVDLEAFNGNGECNCPRFQIFFRSHLEKGAMPNRKLQCWHIHEALKELGHLAQVEIIKRRRREARDAQRRAENAAQLAAAHNRALRQQTGSEVPQRRVSNYYLHDA